MGICKHKRKQYHKPKADCLNCWIQYMTECPYALITAKDLRRILVYALNIEMIKDIAWASYRDYLERDMEKEKNYVKTKLIRY